MCGIVGYVGSKDVIPILMDGLYRLEYRGYDSAGIAVINNNKEISIIKNVGKIESLDNKVSNFLKKHKIESHCGIAHTRWATHGEVTEKNAHPHFTENKDFVIVHNGIIENYKQLKDNLAAEGHKFSSETDSEVLIHLIEKFYEGDLEEAVRKALSKVIGTYGILVISKYEPDVIIGARKGSPLILGIGKNEYILASDVSAIRQITDNVVFLNDSQIVKVSKDGYKISTLNKEYIEGEITKVDWDIEHYSKNGYPTYMEKEIHEQPNTILETIRGRIVTSEGIIKLGGLQDYLDLMKRVKKITIVACGTSWHAGLIGKYWIENLADVPTEVEYAAEFRYRNPIILNDHIVIAISQSGETADTIGAVREAKIKGAKVFGITNVVGSTLARETDAGVYIHAGPEIGVASTKAFTGQLTVLLMIALHLGRMRRLSIESFLNIARELEEIPQKMEKIFTQKELIKEIAHEFKGFSNALYLGRGVNYPVALEGALKLKEISYIHAEGYPAAEMKHGPIALIDENMPSVVIATKDFLYDKIISNIQEIRSRKGKVFVVATEGDEEIKKYAHRVVFIPKTIDFLTPFLSVVPLQLLAYYVATLNGHDVDKPRNLAKSVTVE